MDLKFSDDFFKEEVIDGFTVPEMMKRNWAAGLKILSVIDDICRKYNIKYFIQYGTLLGAVRHKGYIPWDDDLDIGMLREDYNKFFSIASTVLPKGYCVISYKRILEKTNMVERVTNGIDCIEDIEWRKNNFYGFPFIAGVDIFPFDFIPEDESDRKFTAQICEIIDSYLGLAASGKCDNEKLESILCRIEGMLNVEIKRDGTESTQIEYLLDYIYQIFDRSDTAMVSWASRVYSNSKMKKYILPVDIYEDLIELEFEGINLPAPRDYDRVLTEIYGDYMVEDRTPSHDYPCYKSQAKKWLFGHDCG